MTSDPTHDSGPGSSGSGGAVPNGGPDPDSALVDGGPIAGVSDERLFELYRDGRSDLLRPLVDRHHDDLLRFLYRMLGDRQAAEDIFQETFIQAHVASRTFDVSRRFRPWLFTIAANKARDYMRKRGRRPMQELSAPVGGGDERTSFVDLMEIDVPGPGDRLDRAERDRLVQQAVDRLSPTMKEVLLLAYFQRLSYQQIAEELGVPLGTVKSRLHAAVAGFARHWQAVAGKEARGFGDGTNG